MGVEKVSELVLYTNTVTDGLFGTLTSVTFFFVLAMIFLRRSSFEESVTASAFFSFWLCLFLVAVGLVDSYLLLVFGIVFSFGGLWMYFSTRKG